MRKAGDEFALFGTTVGIAHMVGICTIDINGAEIEALLLEMIAELLEFVEEKLLLVVVVFMSMNSLVTGRFLLRFVRSSVAEAEATGAAVGIFKVPLTDMAMAGTVPVPVALMMAGSACSKSQRMVSPSDLWPSSRVSWKTLAAHVAGIRILLPRPSTLVCRSFLDDFITGGASGGAGFSSAASGSSSLRDKLIVDGTMRIGCAIVRGGGGLDPMLSLVGFTCIPPNS